MDFVRQLVYFALLVFLLSRVYEAICKLASDQVAVAQSTDSAEVRMFPSFTFCPDKKGPGKSVFNFIIDWSTKSLNRLYQNVDPLSHMLLVMRHSYKTENGTPISIDVKGDELNQFVDVTIVMVNSNSLDLKSCFTYNPPGPTSIGDKLYFKLNMTGIATWNVYMYTKGQFLFGLIRNFDSNKHAIRIPRADQGGTYSHYKQFLLSEVQSQYLNTKDLPCKSPEHATNMADCIEKTVEKDFNCTLPWRNSNATNVTCGEVNVNKMDVQSFWKHLNGLSARSLYRKTGCQASCIRSKYEAILAESNEKVETTSDDILALHYILNGEDFTINKHYWVYDGNSFIADCGGYLGLLLGHSVLTGYDAIKNLYRSVTKWTI